MDNWYALCVAAGKEWDVYEKLAAQADQAALPCEWRVERRQGKERRRRHLYIPGYVFMLGHLSGDQYYAALNIPGARKFVGGGTPTPIPGEQMQMVLALHYNGLSAIPPTAMCRPNGTHTLAGGPLEEMMPRIIQYDVRTERATIEVKLLDKTHRVTVTAPEEPQP